MENTRSHAVPPFARLGRPERSERPTKNTEHDEDYGDLVFSAGWLKFLKTMSEQAKVLHHDLVSRPLTQEQTIGAKAALAVMMKVLSPVYEKAGVPVPEYILVLLTGEFQS